MDRKRYIIAYYYAVLTITGSINRISCQYFDVWPYNTYAGYKDANAVEEVKSDDYLNPWLFDVPQNEPVKSTNNFAPAAVPQSNNNFNGPQASAGMNNNLYNQPAAPLANNNNFYAPQQQPVHNAHNINQNPPQQWSQQAGHNQNIMHQNPPQQWSQQTGHNQNNNNAHQIQQQANDAANAAALARDAMLMEAVNNFDQKVAGDFHYGNTGHFYAQEKSPAAADGGLNPWLSASHDNTPEWAKNRPNQPQAPIGPPRKTKWEMEEEDNKKKAELYQKTAHLAPPSFIHTTYIRGHPQVERAHVEMANRHAPQRREQMVQQGTYQEVPKNYYEGKAPPKITLEEVQEANLEAIREKQRKLRPLRQDPPADVQRTNWLSEKIQQLKGNACNSKAFQSFYVIFAIIALSHIIMYSNFWFIANYK